MRLRLHRPLALLLTLLALPAAGAATEVLYPAASLALPLNDSGVGARAMALGSAYAGLAEGGATLFWNPAGLAFLPSVDLSLHHESGLDGIYRETGVLGIPLGAHGGLAAAADYVNDGNFDGRDASGNAIAPYSAGDLTGALGLGYAFTRTLGLGLEARYTQQTLADTSYGSFSAGLGALWKPSKILWLGADLLNLGPEVAGSQLTSSFDLGASLHGKAGNSNALVLALGFKDQVGGVQYLQAGLEDVVLSTLALRLGYQDPLSDTELTGLTGLTAGLGLDVGPLSLDYAYLPFGELGSSQRLSLCYHFPSGPATGEPRRPKTGVRAEAKADSPEALAQRTKMYHDRVLKNPRDYAAWWSLGNCFLKSDALSRAKYCYERALKLAPDNGPMKEWFKKFIAHHPGLK